MQLLPLEMVSFACSKCGYMIANAWCVAMLGTLVGAILVQYASWRWIFWLITMIALPISAACPYLIPVMPDHEDTKVLQLDFVGVSTLTGAFC